MPVFDAPLVGPIELGAPSARWTPLIAYTPLPTPWISFPAQGSRGRLDAEINLRSPQGGVGGQRI